MAEQLDTTNGLHKNTIVITSTFPVQYYYSIKNCVEVKVDEYDFEKLQRFIKSSYKNTNIVIDSRLEYLILATGLAYKDYCLVYDVNDSFTKTFYQYLSSRSVLDQRGLFVYTVNGRKLIDLYMFIRHFCTNLSIAWNTDRAIEICKNNTSFIDIVLNYIGIHKYNMCDKISDIIKEMNVIVRCNFSKRKLLFMDIDELYTTITAMKYIENTVKVYY